MNIGNTAVGKLALIVSCAAALAACQSKPPEAPLVPPQQPVQQPAPPRQAPPPQAGPAATPATPANPNVILPGSERDFVINIGERVFFDTDSYTIRSDARPVLDAQANWLAQYPSVTVRLEGNADERGTREYNFALGERRANSVRDYLVARGVAPSRISVVSYGKDRPIVEGSGEQAWQQNRNSRTGITGGAR